jgi:thiol-disulfide isomerase/thioredoxin
MAKSEGSAPETELQENVSASQKKSYGSTTAVPKWLLISTMFLLIVRAGLSISESISPPKASEEIKWRTPDTITPSDRGSDKLFFYEFSADWCEPCKQLESTALSSREVVKFLNEKFIPVRVVDRKREDGKNTPATQELEDMFSVQAFPTMVVALPDGTKIQDQLGVVNAVGLRKVLSEANTLSNYFHGKECLINAEPKLASEYFEAFLNQTHWNHWRAPFASILCALAFETMHDQAGSKRILEKAITTFKDHSFPYPIITHLAGKISFDELLKEAGENKGSRLMAYAYSGVMDFSRGNTAKAEEKLSWVRSNSNDETSFEYRISRSILAQLKSKRVTQLTMPQKQDVLNHK